MSKKLEVLDFVIDLLKEQEDRLDKFAHLLDGLTNRFDTIADSIERLTYRLEETTRRIEAFWENSDFHQSAQKEDTQ